MPVEVVVVPMLGPASGTRRLEAQLVLVVGHAPAVTRAAVPLLELERREVAPVPRHSDEQPDVSVPRPSVIHELKLVTIRLTRFAQRREACGEAS